MTEHSTTPVAAADASTRPDQPPIDRSVLALFGLFGGIGPYAALRHRISPTIGYSYAPEVSLTDIGAAAGMAGPGLVARLRRA